MPYPVPFRKLIPALALACLAFPLPSAQAAISGSSSSAASIGDFAETAALHGFTKDDLKILQFRRKETATKAKDLKAEIKEMEELLAAKDPEATQEKLDKLKKDLTGVEELQAAIDKLIAQAKADIAAQKEEDKKDSDNASSGGKGSSGGSDMVNQIKEALISAALQKMLGNGGNNALSQLFGAPGGINGGTQVATNPNANFTGGSGDGRTPEEIKKAEEERKKAEELAKLPLCGTTDTMPGKLEDDTVVKPAPAERDDSGKLVRNNTPAKPATRDDSGKLVKEKPAPTPPVKPTVTACRPPQVDTPNPTGMGSAKGVGPGAIDSLEEARNAVGKFYCNPATSDCSRNGNPEQCASLTKYFAPEVGRASEWRRGTLVKGANIPIGTPIATFNYGNYYCDPNRSGCGIPGGRITHTGIYLGQNAQGIQVLDQSNGRPARIHTIAWNGNGLAGNNYSTIVRAGSSWLNTIPMFQPVWMALGLTPLDGGLLKS